VAWDLKVAIIVFLNGNSSKLLWLGSWKYLWNILGW